MKVDEKMYSSNILRGQDIEDTLLATVQEVGTVQFDNDDGSKRDALSLTVTSEDLDKPKSFALGMKQTKVLVDAFGDDTDRWIGRKIRLTPVPSQTPQGKPTTSIAVTIPKK